MNIKVTPTKTPAAKPASERALGYAKGFTAPR